MATPRSRWSWALPLLVVIGIATTVALRPAVPIKIKTVTPTVGPVEETIIASSVGTVEPLQTALLCAEISGRVTHIKIRQGRAAAGTPLLLLDRADLESDRERNAREIVTSKLRVDQAQLRVEKIQAELRRMKEPQDPAQVIEALQKDLAIAQKEVDIQNSAVRTLESALQLLDLRLDKTTIKAPFDGIVTKLQVEVGEAVSPGKTVLIFQSAPPYLIRVPIDEADAGRVAVGNNARIRLDAFRDKTFPATLAEIMPTASTDQKNNRTVDVKVNVPTLPAEAVAGMSAHVEIILRVRNDCLRLPTAQIRQDRTSKVQYVLVLEGGVLRKRIVKTGLWNWDLTEILEGLGGKEVVAAQPADPDNTSSLKDGQRAEPADGP